ncbi:hypothetical protein CRG98_017851 [Punica granatum]|uniref:Uncharacterized protein n=1 Tax=Punica granatum TaxID=22663 RepID=A0A2I0JZJ7_PUNGR|nr:hypothetical protein CRG98_017851 [Punica granatum]
MDTLYVSECSGGLETRKQILFNLDDRSEVIRFCRLFAPLRSVLHVSETTAISVCRRPRLAERNDPFFFELGSTREAKMSSEKQSETYSLVRVTLGCVQTYFQVLFIGSWIGRPGSLVKKASANVRECLGLSRRLLKCARGCHWSFCSCLRVRMFAFVGPIVNSDPSFGRVFSVGAGGPKWGADSLPLFGCVLG